MRTIGYKAFKLRFRLRYGIGSSNADNVKASLFRLCDELRFNAFGFN